MRDHLVIVGATGAVGREMLKILEKRGFPAERLHVVASQRSEGVKLTYGETTLTVERLGTEVFERAKAALFSAGAETSRRWATVAVQAGAVVIDNSSAFRMDKDVPLVIPEVNPLRIKRRPRGIIANPNCATIQLLVALQPLIATFPIQRLVVTTLQAVSGKGARALAEFDEQTNALAKGHTPPTKIFPGIIAGNILSDWAHLPDGSSEEEVKIVNESRKILELPGLPVSATCFRVPVRNAHTVSAWVQFTSSVKRHQALDLLREAPGVTLMEEIGPGKHPQPREVSGQDNVYVGRVRQDSTDPKALQIWIVGDNLRKGAALNAIQIFDRL